MAVIKNLLKATGLLHRLSTRHPFAFLGCLLKTAQAIGLEVSNEVLEAAYEIVR